MPATEYHPPATPDTPILDDSEVTDRKLLLTVLQAALDGLGVRSVLAGQYRLVLRYSVSPLPPSGPTDPTLHVFTPDGVRVTTTDGTTYRLDDGQQFPVTDPAAAAAIICRPLAAGSHSDPGPAVAQGRSA